MKVVRVCMLLLGFSAVVLLPASAVAGGGRGGGGPCAGFAAGSTLVMLDSCFDGVAHFVDAGGTLRVENQGELPHSFTAVDGSFDTGILSPGKSVDIPVETAGIVTVYCTLHGTVQGDGMAGALVIGVPPPNKVGIASSDTNLREALAEHDEIMLKQIEAQSQTLGEIKAEMAAVNRAVGGAASGGQPVAVTALSLAGIVLGGSALAAVLSRRPRT